MTETPKRLEQLGTLMAAMVAVVLAGAMPEPARQLTARLQPPRPALDVTQKAKCVVPLVRRFPRAFVPGKHPLAGFCGNGGFRPRAGLRLAEMLSERFAISISNARMLVTHLPYAQGMPSTIVRDVALEIASGDVVRAQLALDSRAGYGLRNANMYTLGRYGCGRCLVSFLWRYSGDPDQLWIALRDSLAQVQANLSGRAA